MRLLHEFLWQVLFGIKERKQETRTEYELQQSGMIHCGLTGVDPPSGVKRQPKTSGSVDPGSVDPGSVDPGSVTSESVDPGSVDSGSKEPESGNSEVAVDMKERGERLSTGEFDAKTHDYDWIQYLEPLPLYDLPVGWFKLADATSIMPLSVFCNIMGIVTEVQ
jgi:hypothetical protein